MDEDYAAKVAARQVHVADDGGHVAGALWEGLRRRIARWRDRPDPGPVDIARALPVAYGVASLLIGMSVLLIYADIVNPVNFG